MKSACEKCLVYTIRHNKEPLCECAICKKEALKWYQSPRGNFYLECLNCGVSVAVDLNTPCETDRDLDKKRVLTIKVQEATINKEDFLFLSKILHVNVSQIYKGFKNGIEIELENSDYLKAIDALKTFGIEYEPDNLKVEQKYSLYKECNYPHSRMNY